MKVRCRNCGELLNYHAWIKDWKSGWESEDSNIDGDKDSYISVDPGHVCKSTSIQNKLSDETMEYVKQAVDVAINKLNKNMSI